MSTTQEDIRAGVFKLLFPYSTVVGSKLVDRILAYLHSQGCVLKGDWLGFSHPHLSAYYAVRPLVEEGAHDEPA